MRSEPAPGPVLRGTVIAAAAATSVVLVSAALGSERGHWGAALVALPLLVGAVVLAKLEYPRLLAAAWAALALMLRTSF